MKSMYKTVEAHITAQKEYDKAKEKLWESELELARVCRKLGSTSKLSPLVQLLAEILLKKIGT